MRIPGVASMLMIQRGNILKQQLKWELRNLAFQIMFHVHFGMAMFPEFV